MLFYPGGNYKLLTAFPCSSLLFIKRRNSEIVVKGYKTSVVGFCVSVDEIGLLRAPTESAYPEVPAFPELCVKEDGEGRRVEVVLRWSWSPLKQRPVKFCFSCEVTSLLSPYKNTCLPFPLRVGVGCYFLPSIPTCFTAEIP